MVTCRHWHIGLRGMSSAAGGAAATVDSEAAVGKIHYLVGMVILAENQHHLFFANLSRRGEGHLSWQVWTLIPRDYIFRISRILDIIEPHRLLRFHMSPNLQFSIASSSS